MLLSDFDILMTDLFPYTAAQADLLVSELFFITYCYSEEEKIKFGLGGRPKICT